MPVPEWLGKRCQYQVLERILCWEEISSAADTIWYICFWKLAIPTKIGSHLIKKPTKNSCICSSRNMKNVYSTIMIEYKVKIIHIIIRMGKCTYYILKIGQQKNRISVHPKIILVKRRQSTQRNTYCLIHL